MKSKTVITYRVALILMVMTLFNSGCGLIDIFVRALRGYCEAPEWVVTRTDDPAGSGLCTAEDCSLRKAVTASNSCPGTQIIRIPAGTYLITRAGTDDDGNRTGDLDITDSVNVIGDGEAVIDGNRLDRVLDIFAPANATLASITITNGSWVDGGGIRNAGTLTMAGGAIQNNLGRRGAGLFNQGTAELDSVNIQDNQAERGFGGGIYNEGNLSLTHGAILRNMGTAGVQGGGLFNAGTAVLDGANVEVNTAGLAGGGIYNSGFFTMTAGRVQKNSAGGGGAGLYNSPDGSLSLSGVEVSENMLGFLVDPFGLPASTGAGLANEGQATLVGCLISRNQAGNSRGGGIVNNGTLTLTITTIESNIGLQGAGLFNFGVAFVDGSTINDNTATGFDVLAGIGGGIFNNYQASLTLTNSTLSHNAAVSSGSFYVGGAGLYNEGVAELSNVTVTANDPDGLYSGLPGIDAEAPPVGPPAARLKNTIIAGNMLIDCGGATIISLGHNLDGDGTCFLTEAGDLPYLDPRLDPLAPNGGSTLTHALQIASLAIDNGSSCPAIDQRSFPRPRPVGGACDIGAYEYDPANVSVPWPITTPAVTATTATATTATTATPTTATTATPTTATAPIFTFTQQANCRKGPNTLYDLLGFGQIDQQVLIQGLSEPLGWYYVLLPDGVTRCWVAGSTGILTGPLDGLAVVPASKLLVGPAAPGLDVSNQTCDAKKYVVHLSWHDVEGETAYRVYRDGTLIATLDVDTDSFDDTSPDYKPHSYQVEAYNDYGAAGSPDINSEGCVY